MKKLKNIFKPAKKTKAKAPTRITNETIAEHRERVISEGKRFKYPVQYTKNKLVINAILVGLVALVAFALFCWWQLYKVQSTADFFYRLTRIVPVPVASVADRSVKYGDYLLNYRTSEVYLNTVTGQGDNIENDITTYNYYKVQAMENAVADVYAAKLADENNVTVTDKDVDEAIKTSRQIASSQGEVSQNVFNRSISKLYGISPAELRYYLKKRLLRQKVSYVIDATAKDTSDKVDKLLAADPETAFDEIGAEINQANPDQVQVLVSGWVSKDNKDGGIAAAASKLKPNQITGPIKSNSGDGYYFVRLLETNDNDEINYQFIKIPLTEFSKRLKAMQDDNKIDYYIKLPEVQNQEGIY